MNNLETRSIDPNGSLERKVVEIKEILRNIQKDLDNIQAKSNIVEKDNYISGEDKDKIGKFLEEFEQGGEYMRALTDMRSDVKSFEKNIFYGNGFSPFDLEEKLKKIKDQETKFSS